MKPKSENTIQATVLQSLLKQALSTVARAASGKSSMPVLECVLLSQTVDGLRLAATNLELGVTCRIGARFAEAAFPQDLLAVPAKTFTDLIGTLPEGDVQLIFDPKTMSVQVASGGSKSKIKGIDPQEFPPIPTAATEGSVSLALPAEIGKIVQQVVLAASADQARPVLTGVYLTVQDAGDGTSQLTLSAADGFRMARRKATLAAPVSKPINAIIPAPAMKELVRIAKEAEVITAIVERNRVIFQAGDITLVSQTIEGAYPNLDQVIPTSFKTRTVLVTAEFLKACQQAEIFSRSDHYTTVLDIAGEQIKVGGMSSETGATTTTLAAQSEGTPLSIAFNAVFLKQGIEALSTPTFALETNAETSPGVIRPVGETATEFLYVAMPMHRDVVDVDEAASVAASVASAQPAQGG
jgi:DNA polymerase-3 subunit beta